MIGAFIHLRVSHTKDGDLLSAVPQRQMERSYEETIGKSFVKAVTTLEWAALRVSEPQNSQTCIQQAFLGCILICLTLRIQRQNNKLLHLRNSSFRDYMAPNKVQRDERCRKK